MVKKKTGKTGGQPKIPDFLNRLVDNVRLIYLVNNMTEEEILQDEEERELEKGREINDL